MNFYNSHKFGIVSVILIAFLCVSMSAIFTGNTEAASACDELRKAKEHAEGHLETAQLIHASTSALLMQAVLRRQLNEFIFGKEEAKKKSPSDETIAELTAADVVAYAVLKMEQISFDAAQEAYGNCLRLHRHSCGCPSTVQNVTSCQCSNMRSWKYGYGVNCPCYESS